MKPFSANPSGRLITSILFLAMSLPEAVPFSLRWLLCRLEKQPALASLLLYSSPVPRFQIFLFLGLFPHVDSALQELCKKEYREGRHFKPADVIILLFSLIDHSARYRIWGWKSFLLSVLKALLCNLPASRVAAEQAHFSLISNPVSFSLVSFRIFSLFLTFWISLVWIFISWHCKLYDCRDLYLGCLLLSFQRFSLYWVETPFQDGGGQPAYCRGWGRGWGSHCFSYRF